MGESIDVSVYEAIYALPKQLLRDCIYLAVRNHASVTAGQLLQTKTPLFAELSITPKTATLTWQEQIDPSLFPNQAVRDAIATHTAPIEPETAHKDPVQHVWLERCLASACLKGDVAAVVALATRCRQELGVSNDGPLPLASCQLQRVLDSTTAILTEAEAQVLIAAILGLAQNCHFALPQLATMAACRGYTSLLAELTIRSLVDFPQLLSEHRLWSPTSARNTNTTARHVRQLARATPLEACVLSRNLPLFAARLRCYGPPPSSVQAAKLRMLCQGNADWLQQVQQASQPWGPLNSAQLRWVYCQQAFHLLMALELTDIDGLKVPPGLAMMVVRQSIGIEQVCESN